MGYGRCQDLRARTTRFALQVIDLYRHIPRSELGGIMARQFVRSGTSVGAQYREACRARSVAEFCSKLQSAIQELDETGYWLELLVESKVMPAPSCQALVDEVDALTRIMVTSAATAQKHADSKT
jgi:four helix bundle protein